MVRGGFIWTSEDGTTWNGGPVPLWASQVSLDEGATWRPTVVTPATMPPTQVQTAVASPAGGWLGLGFHNQVGLNKLWSVVRSNDGMTWEEVLADPCSDIADERVESAFDDPIPLGDRWLVTHTCFVSWRPQRSELYLLEQDGSDPRPVAATDQPGLYFGHPTTVDGTVVVPELDINGSTTLLHLHT